MTPARSVFPLPIGDYAHSAQATLWEVLRERAGHEPANVVALVIFALAVAHTLLAGRIARWATHRFEAGSMAGRAWHVASEVELVFGRWAVVLLALLSTLKGGAAVVRYVSEGVSYVEPLFVAVIMTMAASRPVLDFAERLLGAAARLGRCTPAAWWLAILVFAPLLGSFITEPAAMTIAASLLARKFYALHPSRRLRYATLGLLFVNISVGGTLTHFAAPPVLMVARAWQWDLVYMLTHFGWRAALGIATATGIYYLIFRRELAELGWKKSASANEPDRSTAPAWIVATHVAFIAFTVWRAHHPIWFIAGFFVFLGFVRMTARHQARVEFREPLFVGIFLAGLVIHGGLQAWWIEPVLRRLGDTTLFAGAAALTAFNDNAAVTYLATLVPGLSDPMRFAVVAGAVVGGGLTVIANAPNPAGQALLGRYFSSGISPFKLAGSALVPTLAVAAIFLM